MLNIHCSYLGVEYSSLLCSRLNIISGMSCLRQTSAGTKSGRALLLVCLLDDRPLTRSIVAYRLVPADCVVLARSSVVLGWAHPPTWTLSRSPLQQTVCTFRYLEVWLRRRALLIFRAVFVPCKKNRRNGEVVYFTPSNQAKIGNNDLFWHKRQVPSINFD